MKNILNTWNAFNLLKNIHPQKIIKGFPVIFYGDIFRSDTSRWNIYFSNAKSSYMLTMSYERPCSPDKFSKKCMVLGEPHFHAIGV